MNAPTHIIGGAVFAGTLCSFTDVNIFENQTYIIACAAFSILPDIDTTKSAIGKVFYPVAWLIYRKLGHRTITHSLLFLAFIWLLVWSLYKFQIVTDPAMIKIAVFSVISHFIFDMITISGIPLLYPFAKNPCVIPGNPSYRFKSGELKSELIVSGICGLLCITMQPLYSNGFWVSYNRLFGTIKHVDRENKNTEFYVICEYSYILNAETHEGEALVITSNSEELVLFDRKKVFTLNSENPQLKMNYARPRISNVEKRFDELLLHNISYDSLQNILSGKLASGLIQSSKNVRYIDDAVTYYTNFIKFANRYDFNIIASADTSKTTLKRSIARLEASIAQSYQKHQNELNKWAAYEKKIINITDSLKSESLTPYQRNKLQRELIRLRSRNNEKPVFIPPAAQIADLEIQKKTLMESDLTFSGHITLLVFGYEEDTTGSDGEPQRSISGKPIYDHERLFASVKPSNTTNN